MNSTNAAKTHSLAIRTTAFTILLIATFILAYFPVWKRLVLAWSTSDEHSHGFLIIPVCCYVLWRKRGILTKIPLKPSGWGLSLVIFSLLLYLFADFAQILTAMSFSMVLVLAGGVIYYYGFFMFKF